MTVMRLSDFITTSMEQILIEWERFASTIVPPALSMDGKALRNHARLMLEAIALDLRNEQSSEQQEQKSFGLGRLIHDESSAETHAAARLFSGFSIEQLVSEYRALRASVLKLWAKQQMVGLQTDAADITRFNEAIDQALAESVARYAEMVTKSQHLFLAILGHDLRNPLATALMASRFIMEGPGVDSQYATAANRIHTAGQRMNSLVNDLIDYTRTNLGANLPIIIKSLDMVALCNDAVAEQALAHPERQFKVVIEGDGRGEWDDNRIAQVLSNLLGNAVQYGVPGEPIVLRLHSTDTEVVLCVENMGKIIPQEKIAMIFQPLVRLAGGNAEPHSTSLGIGLYIAREIVRSHGGAISVTSTEEQGTVFAVTLPRHAVATPVQRWIAPPA